MRFQWVVYLIEAFLVINILLLYIRVYDAPRAEAPRPHAGRRGPNRAGRGACSSRSPTS